MVVSDAEKQKILISPDWQLWVSENGGGSKRWKEVQDLREGSIPVDIHARNFIADIQTRYLIAEFIRRTHHYRAAKVITQHQAHLGRWAFDDPALMRTITDVCVAHGLRQHELEDRGRYPDRRDIKGELVNVRFMAILLRLGDLLDMNYDRACPLLLNAACPLPPDSLAHWTQYQRITHRLTAHDRIEITAKCVNLDEHRFLQDWCQWLVDELRDAKIVMAKSSRHQNWQPPVATLTGDTPTIFIKPAEGATYLFRNWTFELDHEAIFQRLIYDAYGSSNVFIRELIQNAADANRCQMFYEIGKENSSCPQYPTQVDLERRRRYPIRISLENIEKTNDLSGEIEIRQVLVIEDSGIGMDEDIIERYFLQIGRSYYATEEFRRKFTFTPTSQFGIGFLSVFAVSDEITVETYKPSSENAKPIKLKLTGPRSYLLPERGTKRNAGTRIQILLNEEMPINRLTELVEGWCKKLEFPIEISEIGHVTTIEAEDSSGFLNEVSDVTKEGRRFYIRSFPTEIDGIEGEFYIFVRSDEGGERWDLRTWAEESYLRQNPQGRIPEMPSNLTCLHGISINSSPLLKSNRQLSARIDIRTPIIKPTLSRDSSRRNNSLDDSVSDVLMERLEQITAQHLLESAYNGSDSEWQYKQKLVTAFGSSKFWRDLPGTVRIYEGNRPHQRSLASILEPNLRVVLNQPQFGIYKEKDVDPNEIILDSDEPYLLSSDLGHLSKTHLDELFVNRQIKIIKQLESGHLIIEWQTGEPELFSQSYPIVLLFPLLVENVIGTPIHRTSSNGDTCILNLRHPFIQWVRKFNEACLSSTYGLNKNQCPQLVGLLRNPLTLQGYEIDKLQNYINKIHEIPGLPAELYPPKIELTRDMFLLFPSIR